MSAAVHKHKSKVISFRSTKNLNLGKFNEDLSNAPWHVGEVFDTANDYSTHWKMLLESIMDEHLPVKKMRVTDRDIPYMNPAWKKAIRLKRKYAKQFAKNRTPENWELKSWWNTATNERSKAIKTYWRDKADHLKSKPREF